MSTIAEPTTEHDQKKHQIRCDQRAHPGDGKRAPCKHIVRIVVVRDDELTAVRRSRASSESHVLTDVELRIGEAILKKMAAPLSAERTSEPPKSMFDVLEPTDIVVIGQEAASVRMDDARKPPTLGLAAHNDRNKDTVLRVWTESDTIEYQCDEPFEIVQVKKAGWEIYDAPDDPFGNSKDGYKAHIRDAEGENEKPLWVWTSGLLPARANNQQYKMTFKIFDKNGENGEEVDPDVVCGDPPPI
jgi:hypothetical protein